MNIFELLNEARKSKATDVHITVGLPPLFRINGSIIRSQFDSLDESKIMGFVHSIVDEEQKRIFSNFKDIDFSIYDSLERRYRVNVYYQQQKPCMAIRLLNDSIPNFDDLNIPISIKNLSNLNRGLILVTGPTGSGKSTTMAAMINHLNTTKNLHIVTIEDPIEYVYQHQNSIIHQREVGKDVPTFSDALRSALREDPDVILVGEMRDFETIQAALTAAETGHLVISTLHTNSAMSSIDRIIDVFPEHQQQQIRIQLANTLKGVVSQQLINKIDQSGRIAAFEILVVNDAVATLIREKKTHQISNVIQTSSKLGMQLMDQELIGLYQKGLISLEEAIEKSYSSDLITKIHR